MRTLKHTNSKKEKKETIAPQLVPHSQLSEFSRRVMCTVRVLVSASFSEFYY